MWSLLFSCTAADPPVTGVAPTDDTSGIDVIDLGPIVQEQLQGQRLPALGAAVISPQGLVGVGVSGLRNIDESVVVEDADLWHLGSDTKAMTATLLAMLIEDGLLRWDTTLPQAFPGVELDPAWAAVTLEDLLHHRGGTDSSLAADHPSLWADLWGYDDGCEARQWFPGALLQDPPSETVGDYIYSNAGYILIGAAIEQATGSCWQDLLRARLFEPLDMNACGFGAPLGTGPLDEPWGHTDSGDSLVPVDPTQSGADNPPGLGPAGTVHCSLPSWGRFVGMHLAGAMGDPQLISADSFSHLHTPVGDYAGGWLVGEGSTGPYLAHAGSNTMWLAWTVIEPQQERATLVVTNAYTDGAMDAVLQVQDAVTAAID